jgi:hypothetical protein
MSYRTTPGEALGRVKAQMVTAVNNAAIDAAPINIPFDLFASIAGSGGLALTDDGLLSASANS